jgi:class 3 adenylate cyclase
MTVDQASTITRGFLFADLRGYTEFVEQRGAAAAAELLTRYRALAQAEIGRLGGAEIKTEGDSFYVAFDSVSSAVRCGLAITWSDLEREPELDEELGRGCEVANDDSDVVQALDRHVAPAATASQKASNSGAAVITSIA